MATKLQYYGAVAESTLNNLTANRGNWMHFLDTAAQLYKYPFTDQTMIYAQRPDATACAEIELWNEQFNRWVRRGSKGIALIDDSGSYPKIKYVFDVSDTEASLHRAKPVKLWEMTQEHKAPVLAELTRVYDDITDSLGESFHNIAKQLASEYYEDNAREIGFRAENSFLEPDAAYDFAGTLIEQTDDSALRAAFEDALTASTAYMIMQRCGLDTSEYYDVEDFQAITNFNTPDMINALGVASSELSEQVLREIEIVIRKYERVKNAERSTENERGTDLHAGGRLSAPEHRAERAADGGNGTAGTVRENEESVSERAPENNVQSLAYEREAVPASAGGGRGGDGANGTDYDSTDSAERTAEQGNRPDGVDGDDEHAESASRGNGSERTDLRGLDETQGAADEAAPLSMADAAWLHVDLNERLIAVVTSNDTILNAALNSDKENTLDEIRAAVTKLRTDISIEIAESSWSDKRGMLAELDNYFDKERKPPLAESLYDAVIRSDEYIERQAERDESETQAAPEPPVLYTPPPDNETLSQVGIRSIDEIISTSAVRSAEVDSILRDGANSNKSHLRIAARFAKDKTPEELTAYLRREYLHGAGEHFVSRSDSESGKGFDFGKDNHRVCAWFDDSGIQLAIGVTAKNNIHTVTIPWESAAARVSELIREGQYVSADVFDEALDNEKTALASRLWHFYRDDMYAIPDEWQAHTGGYPGDTALIKSLFDDPNERQAILDRLESDVPISKTMERDRRTYHNADVLLADMRDAILPPTLYPNAVYRHTQDFTYFLTDDEINAALTHGSNFSESKFRILSHFLNDRTPKETIDFLKREYGHGGSTWTDTNGWRDAEPGKGVTLKRGSIMKPDCEVNLKWPAVSKRIEQLISDGRYMTRAELDYIPNYELLMLARQINSFYYNLPEEYERPFTGRFDYSFNMNRDESGKTDLDFLYPGEAEWSFLREFFDNTESVNTLLAQMEPIFVNTMEEDRYYNTRKAAWYSLNDLHDGTYTLFPNVDKLPEPGTVTARRFNEPHRENIIDLNERDYFAEPVTGEQLTLEGMFPALPSVDEQQTKFEEQRNQDERNADEPFLNIPDADKARIAKQFTENPRSREAVSLVREVYGDTLPMALPQTIKRLTTLVAEGKFNVPDYHKLPIIQDCERIKQENDGAIVFYQLGDFFEVYGTDAELVSEKLEIMLTQSRTGLPEPVPMCGFPRSVLANNARTLNEAGYTIAVASVMANGERNVTLYNAKPQLRDVPYNVGDRFTYDGKPHEISQIDDFVKTQNLSVSSDYPITDFTTFLRYDFERMLSDGEIVIEPPEAPVAVKTDMSATDIIAAEMPEPEPPLDFDTVAQTILARVMADEDYAEALEVAKTRASLRNPCTWALEQSIRDHEKDEPQIYNTYFSDDDFNDDLFNYILRQSWANRPTLEPVFTEITDPATLAEVETVFGDTSSTDAPVTSDAAEQVASPTPIATKLLSQPSDNTAYYLIHYPYGVDEGAVLNLDTLRLIREKADNYVICAETCHLSDEEMAQWNIAFRKLPRDWNLLPESVQAEIRATYPEYEKQWNEMYGRAPELTAAPDTTPAQNFRITDDLLGEGGAKTKFRYNADAISLLHDLEFDDRNATPEEQEILSRYVGWGGLPQVFEEKRAGWENEFIELYTLLSPDEYESARASTLNAHYTSPIVIKAIWDTVERFGFRSGNVLEPSCGVGNFLGLVPESMRNAKMYGIELDSITARIAKKLYPNADIRHMGFEQTGFSDSFFDLAVGNVPFGDYGVVDKRYDKHKFSIHDYFFAKTLDQVRPGGIVCFLTSKFTLDKQNPTVRKYIAQRAELLGAVRLPNDAFLKNAGTETAMDLLILQKRDRVLDIEPEWVHLGLTNDGIPVNRYYLDNPEMVCGTIALDKRMNDKYGRDDYTTCLPIEGADLAEQLKTALSYVQGQYMVEELDDLDGVDNHAIPADLDVKNFSYSLVEDIVYYRENSLMYPVDLPVMTLERIKGMIGLRDCVHTLMELQLDDHSEVEIKAQQVVLNDLYDSFIAEYGLINSTANSRAFNADSAYYLLASLEILDEDGELARKADMFTKRTIKQKTIITHVDTASEALAVSMGEKAHIDLDFMSELTGKDRETLIAELRGVIFMNVGSAESQEKTYVTADEYLSGNVREKLALARAAEATMPGEFTLNVSALEAIQPKDLEAGEIDVRLGTTWIDQKYVQAFMYDLLKTNNYNKRVYQVKYHPYTGEWQVTGKGKSQFSDINATVTYGTERMNAYQIIDDTLNLRDVRVYDYIEDADGKERRVLNKKQTTLAQQRQELIKQSFKDWIWKDPERRQTLVKEYNERFNSTRPREYDGSHIMFAGMNPEILMGKHQVDGAARHIYGGNTLYAHVVGAGKTFTMIAAAMESKRLGLCQKSLFAVPNHLTEQWAGEFLRLYPSANILVATKKDFEKRNRKKFCAKIATGNYDAIIIGHSQLEKIPMSKERQERLLNEQIWEIMEGIDELKHNNGERFSIKQLEKTKKSLQARLQKLSDSVVRDDVVTFEQLGADRLFVDEAHNFKNLFLYTKMRNVAGLSTSEAQKSSDLFMKCRYLDELTGNKGIVFATGTPISNSMTELFTMKRYLQYELLESYGLTHFDAWASTFGETVTSIELAPEGTGYRARTRFAKFYNLPELMAMFKEVADIQTADMLNLPTPIPKYETIVVEPSEIQKEMVEELSERAAAVHNREVSPDVDNMLKITTDGRKIGLDQRLINPLLPDFEGSKVNACADKVHSVWENTKSSNLTQLVFCDYSTPKKDKFNVYDDIKTKLLAKGIPEHEIAFIHDANTENQKKELFAKVRQGKVRILFGSTFKMGAGTNVQDRLFAGHDLDCPWRPSDLEQRSGRTIRQGNLNPEVHIIRYATSGTFDSYLWQTVQKKQEFIAQIMSSKSPARSCEDCDETALSYAEIKALCAGNPQIAEKMNLDNEVAKLRMLKSEHQSMHFRLEDALLKTYPQQIVAVSERIAGIEKDIATYQKAHESCVTVQSFDGSASVSAQFPGMTINGVTHTEKEPAAKALIEACKGIMGKKEENQIGEYMGFKMGLSYDSFSQQIKLSLRGAMTYQLDLSTDTFGNMTRINNSLESLPTKLNCAKESLADIQRQQADAKIELERPFAQESDLAAKEARLALLNADLNIDGDGGFDVLNDTDTREEPSLSQEDDESYGDERDDDYDEYAVEDEYEYESPRVAVPAKSRPSILDNLHSYDGDKKTPVQDNGRINGISI